MSNEKNEICLSAEKCNCPNMLKNSFFDEYERFGLTVQIRGGELCIVDRRIPSKVPTELWIPLKILAQIFAVKNFWQLINSAVSGTKPLTCEKDLVRLYPLGKFGKNGKTILQVSVPKTGGLHLAALVQRGKETQGLPSTVIKMLPLEVMMFVEMLPYYLINRHHGQHVHWTALSAINCFKRWTEEGLENQDVDFLNAFLNALKEDKLKEVMVDLINEGVEMSTNFDVEAMESESFRLEDEIVDSDHFNEVLCNLCFELKYKLEGWEGRDDFTQRAKVVRREPPTVVQNIVNHTFYATYDVGVYVMEETINGNVVESNHPETSKIGEKRKNPALRFDEKTKKSEKRKHDDVRRVDEKEAKTIEKKQKMTEADLEDMRLLFEDDDDFFATSQSVEKTEDIIVTLPVGPTTPPPPKDFVGSAGPSPSTSKMAERLMCSYTSRRNIGPSLAQCRDARSASSSKETLTPVSQSLCAFTGESQSSYIQCAQTPPAIQPAQKSESENGVSINEEELKSLHIHIHDCQGSKVLNFDVKKEGVKITFE